MLLIMRKTFSCLLLIPATIYLEEWGSIPPWRCRRKGQVNKEWVAERSVVSGLKVNLREPPQPGVTLPETLDGVPVRVEIVGTLHKL